MLLSSVPDQWQQVLWRLPAASKQPRLLTRGDLDKHEELFGFVPVKAGSEFKFLLTLAFPGSERNMFFSL